MGDADPLNPYDAPADLPKSPPDAVGNRPLTLRQKALSAVVVAAFFAFGFLAFYLLANRQLILALVAGSASLGCIPLLDHDSSLRDRFAMSLIAPFAVAGLVSFVPLYFQMFRFRWFHDAFNNDGLGPMGLIVFATVGFATGGFIGWRIISWIWLLGTRVKKAHKCSSVET